MGERVKWRIALLCLCAVVTGFVAGCSYAAGVAQNIGWGLQDCLAQGGLDCIPHVLANPGELLGGALVNAGGNLFR